MQYYVIVNGDKVGPLSLEELKAKELFSHTPVWKQGLPDWKTAADFDELAGSYTNQNQGFPDPQMGQAMAYQAQDNGRTNADGLFLVLLCIVAFQGIFFLVYNRYVFPSLYEIFDYGFSSVGGIMLTTLPFFLFSLAPLIISLMVKNSRYRLAMILLSLLPLLGSMINLIERATRMF